MSEALKGGDVVQLKSGGPLMTVLVDAGDGPEASVRCIWYQEKEQKYAAESFSAVTLKRVEPKKTGASPVMGANPVGMY